MVSSFSGSRLLEFLHKNMVKVGLCMLMVVLHLFYNVFPGLHEEISATDRFEKVNNNISEPLKPSALEDEILLNYIASQIVYYANQYTQTPNNFYGYQICKKLILDHIIQANLLKASGTNEYINMKILLKDPESVELTASILIFQSLDKIFSSYADVFPVYTGSKQYFQVLEVKLDYKDDLCDKIKNIKRTPYLCVCKPLEIIQYYDPGLISQVHSHYNWIISDDIYSCSTTCQNINMTCSNAGISSINSCKGMMKVTGCYQCSLEAQNSVPGLYNDACIIAGKAVSCDSSDLVDKICACETPTK